RRMLPLRASRHRSIRVEIGIVRSASPMRATAGSKRAAANCCRSLMRMWCSPCLANWAPLALQNKSEIYSLLFRDSAETLLTMARDGRHLGAEIGFFSVLHSSNQQLLQNPHS